jgi:hypothetical protein
LSADELKLREHLETKVEQSLADANSALREIRDKQLFRFDEDGNRQTWEQYCRNKMKLSKQYVDKMLRAGEVMEMLTETKVSVERVAHAAELSGLTKTEMVVVVEKAQQVAKSENRKPKTSDFKGARNAVGKTKASKFEGSSTSSTGETERANESVGVIVVSSATAKATAAITKSLSRIGIIFKEIENEELTNIEIKATGSQQAAVLEATAQFLRSKGPLTVVINLDK